MPEKISDEVLEQFAVIGTYDDIGDRLCARFGDVVTNIEFSIAVNSAQDKARLGELARQVRGHDAGAVRSLIVGAGG